MLRRFFLSLLFIFLMGSQAFPSSSPSYSGAGKDTSIRSLVLTNDGTELTNNGTFTGSATGWTLASGWTYSTNAVNKDAAGTGALEQDIGAKADAVYLLTFTISAWTAGTTLTPSIGGVNGTAITGNGTYTQYITSTGVANLKFTPTTDVRCTIDTISAKRVDAIITKNSAGSITTFIDGSGVMGGNLLKANPATLGGRGAIANEFVAIGSNGFWSAFTAINSGTNSIINGDKNHPGIVRISSSTSANSGQYVMVAPSSFILSGGEVGNFIFNVVNSTNTTNRFGFHDTTTSADPVDGVWINTAGTTLTGKTANSSTISTTSTNYTISTGTWYRATIVINSDATRVDFYLFDEGGTLLWTDNLTTNIPTTTVTGHGVISTNSGVSAVGLVDIDYMDIAFTKFLRR